MRRSDTTGPPFWERPVWSRPRTCSPSINAAMPSTWLTVTTPVPPMPDHAHAAFGVAHDALRLGQVRRRLRGPRAPPACPGTTVRNDGQSPSTHE